MTEECVCMCGPAQLTWYHLTWYSTLQDSSVLWSFLTNSCYSLMSPLAPLSGYCPHHYLVWLLCRGGQCDTPGRTNMNVLYGVIFTGEEDN